MLTTIFATIFVLGLLIFIHEFGHFIMAKLAGIRVERFSIGFPPRLIGKKIGETDYCISAIPFGGYVKMAGMIDESLDREGIKGEPWEFQSKPLSHKLAALFGGPLMNYLLPIIIFTALVLAHGIGEVRSSRIGEVVPDYPASKAGIVVGDKILSIDGQEITTWDQMTEIIHNRPDQELNVVWEHEGETHHAAIHTRLEKAPIGGEIKEIGIIGISPELTMRRVGLFSAIRYGVDRTIYLTELVFVSVRMLITGKESLRSIGGPVVIAKLAGESARSGFANLLAFMAFLSINLAILNILPIPALDGGHILVLLIEGILRRQLPVKTRILVQQIGMAILLALMIIVVFNDVRNVFF